MRVPRASLAILAGALEPARMQLESSFLSAIEAVRSWRLEGSTLRLFDESQTERVRLSRTGNSGS